MPSTQDHFEVAFDGCTLTRGPVRVDSDHLTIRFDMQGRAASVQFPEDHVIVVPEGGAEKLRSISGWGGYGADGSPFFEWELRRQEAEAVRVVYLDDNDVVVAEERLPASGRFEVDARDAGDAATTRVGQDLRGDARSGPWLSFRREGDPAAE